MSYSPKRMWLWIAAVFVLLVLGALFYFSPFHRVSPDSQPAPTPPSTEWTTAPEGPAVPVNLPETDMTNIPANSSSAASESIE